MKVAINQQPENPQRLSEIKKCLNPGQNISYFDEEENKLIDARKWDLRKKDILASIDAIVKSRDLTAL